MSRIKRRASVPFGASRADSGWRITTRAAQSSGSGIRMNAGTIGRSAGSALLMPVRTLLILSGLLGAASRQDADFSSGHGAHPFGRGSCVIGDADGDGARDVLLLDYAGQAWCPNAATILSGADGLAVTTLHFDDAAFGRAAGRTRVERARGAPDLDGDGIEDFWLERAPPDTSADVWLTACSTAARRALWTVPFGGSLLDELEVAFAADEDCDGTQDVWIQQTRRIPAEASTRVTVVSGRDGRLLRAGTLTKGDVLTPIGDTDGDGVTDAARLVLDCDARKLRVDVLESRAGDHPREIGTVDVACTWTARLHDLGDLDADGVHEIGISHSGNGVCVLSTRGGARLFEREVPFDMTDYSVFGCDVRAAVDAAGRARVFVASRTESEGEVRIWTLPDGESQSVVRFPQAPGGRFGSRLELLSDLDRDGMPEFMCAPEVGSQRATNAVQIASSRTGELLWEAVGVDSHCRIVTEVGTPVSRRVGFDGWFGRLSAVIGDTDGDGVHEVLFVANAVAGGRPLGVVLSGRTAEWSMAFDLSAGQSPQSNGAPVADVASLPDLDGDLLQDFVVERYFPGKPAERWFTAYSSSRCNPLWSIAGMGSGNRRAPRPCAVCDEDVDGVEDALIPGGLRGQEGDIGYATIVSGIDGRMIRPIRVESREDQRDTRLAALGDIDGDGQTDFVVAFQDTWAGRVVVQLRQSSQEQTRGLARVDLYRGNTWGLESLPDLDFDGACDVGVWIESAGFRIVSARTGRTLAEDFEYETRDWSRFCSALTAFVDRDGEPVLLLGAANDGMFNGSVTARALPGATPRFTAWPDGDEWHFGARLIAFDDVDGDLTPDFLAVSDHTRCGLPGTVYMRSGRDGSVLWVARATRSGLRVGR